MVKKASPGVGHNGPPASQEDIRAALALDILFDERKAALNELHKRAMKGVGEKGIPLDELRWLKKIKDEPGSKIESMFRLKWHLIGAVFENLGKQFDLFAPKQSAPETRAAHFTIGLLAGVQGKPCEPPPAVVGADRDEMIRGHNEGAAQRQAAEEKILAMSLDPQNKGTVTDGTPSATTKKAREQAAKDFTKDNGGVNPLIVEGKTYATMRQANKAREALEAAAKAAAKPPAVDPKNKADAPPPAAVAQPTWKGFSTDPEEWFANQKQEFKDWFATVPEGATVNIEHEGVRKAFKVARGDPQDAKAAEEPAPEAPAAEEYEAPHIAGNAPAGTVYRLSSDEPYPSGRVGTYKDGREFSTVNADNSEIAIYDSHPVGTDGAKPQSAQAAEKREEAGVS